MKLTDVQKFDFMKKAAFIADNSSCNYRVGCVGVVPFKLNHRLIKGPEVKSNGVQTYVKTWNETLKGEIFCQSFDDAGRRICCRQVENLKGRDFQKVCSIHAEANLIAKCAKYGIETDGMSVFITNSPCYICAKTLIQSGVSSIYYIAEHTDSTGIDLCLENNVLLEKINPF